MPETTYYREFKSNPEVLPEVETYIVDLAAKHHLDEEQLTKLAMAVSEAASNSILHGNKADSNKLVTVKVLVDENKFTVIFTDQGDGFYPEKVPDPTKPENILKDHGRGIHIMKSYLDDLQYNFTGSGTETILILKK